MSILSDLKHLWSTQEKHWNCMRCFHFTNNFEFQPNATVTGTTSCHAGISAPCSVCLLVSMDPRGQIGGLGNDDSNYVRTIARLLTRCARHNFGHCWLPRYTVYALRSGYLANQFQIFLGSASRITVYGFKTAETMGHESHDQTIYSVLRMSRLCKLLFKCLQCWLYKENPNSRTLKDL